MPNPLIDKMTMADMGIKIGLYCARCNGKVISDQPHECPKDQIDKTQEERNEN
jgi:hypothetical protein